MAVLPDHQGRQVGSQLIRHGLAQLRGRGERIVIVLGHKEYYPRFGFSSEKARCLASPFPPEAFMALELKDGALAGIHWASLGTPLRVRPVTAPSVRFVESCFVVCASAAYK